MMSTRKQKKEVEAKQGILILGSARCVRRGERFDDESIKRNEMHVERWKELTNVQERNEMYHAILCPLNSKARKAMSYKRLCEGTINRIGVTMWNSRKQRENEEYEWFETQGVISSNSAKVAKEWSKEGRRSTKMKPRCGLHMGEKDNKRDSERII